MTPSRCRPLGQVMPHLRGLVSKLMLELHIAPYRSPIECSFMMLTAIVLGIGFCDIYNLNVRWSGGKKVNHPWEYPPQEVVHLVDLVEKIREKKITDVIAEKTVERSTAFRVGSPDAGEDLMK